MKIYLHTRRYKILAKVSKYFTVPSAAAFFFFLTFVASSYLVRDAMSYKPSRLEVRVTHRLRSPISHVCLGCEEVSL